jgi:hypothetical protein
VSRNDYGFRQILKRPGKESLTGGTLPGDVKTARQLDFTARLGTAINVAKVPNYLSVEIFVPRSTFRATFPAMIAPASSTLFFFRQGFKK